MGEKGFPRPQNRRSQQVGFLILSFTIFQVITSINPSIHAYFERGTGSRDHEFAGRKQALPHPNLQRYNFVLKKARGGEKELEVRS